jgi:phage-related protein
VVESLPSARKPAVFVGSSKEDLSAFPQEVKQVMGFAIHKAQIGEKHSDAKPLKGDKAFRGAGVLEVVDDFDGDTYRAVYTVKFAGVVYVLHAFPKKSKKGIATPLSDIRLVKTRLQEAREHYEDNFVAKKTG